MLDHVFTDAIGALRDALEAALLERTATDERFHVDVVGGDTSWETSYGIPGEGSPPRIQADITLDWSTWSQSAFRSWLRNEDDHDAPRIDIGVVLRVQRLAERPDPAMLSAGLPRASAPIGGDRLDRSGLTVETAVDPETCDVVGHAIEIAFDGAYDIDDDTLSDGARLDLHFSAMGGWIASMLVRLGDLDFAHRDAI